MEEILKAALLALAEACDYSLSAHPPEEGILCKFPTHLRGDARKALKRLVKMRFARKHPTRGAMTYSLTREGLIEAQK